MKTVFRLRAKCFIIKNIEQRKRMVENGWNRLPNADNIRLKCELLRENICNLYSDAQLADFIINKHNDIIYLLPGKQANLEEFNQLYNEALTIKNL